MIKTKKCKQCGGDIVFSYETPTKTFVIEDGKIVRDDAWAGPYYDNPQLVFHCSNDVEHDIDSEEISKWSEEIEKIFYTKILPQL